MVLQKRHLICKVSAFAALPSKCPHLMQYNSFNTCYIIILAYFFCICQYYFLIYRIVHNITCYQILILSLSLFLCQLYVFAIQYPLRTSYSLPLTSLSKNLSINIVPKLCFYQYRKKMGKIIFLFLTHNLFLIYFFDTITNKV